MQLARGRGPGDRGDGDVESLFLEPAHRLGDGGEEHLWGGPGTIDALREVGKGCRVTKVDLQNNADVTDRTGNALLDLLHGQRGCCGADAHQLARLMLAHQLNAALVVDAKGAASGIVTSTDYLRLYASAGRHQGTV